MTASFWKNLFKSCSDEPIVNPCVMEDAKEQKKESTKVDSIQETRHGQRPARMVGLSSLFYALSGMEAKNGKRNGTICQRSKG